MFRQTSKILYLPGWVLGVTCTMYNKLVALFLVARSFRLVAFALNAAGLKAPAFFFFF